MKQQINMDLLKQSDEVTEERIAEEFPYPFGNAETFERAFQNYEKQFRQTADCSLTLMIDRRQLYRVCSLVACLLVTVGLSVDSWSRQQKIVPLPQQETQTTTVIVTETRTETTAQVTTESQTTGRQTEERTKKPETTTISALNSDRSQQPTSAAALLTTVEPTETMTAAVITRQTNAAPVSAQQNTPSAVTTRIAPLQTSVTAKIPGQIAPVTEQSTRNTLTNPATTTLIVTTTQPRTEPTQASKTEPTETFCTDVTTDPTESVPVSSSQKQTTKPTQTTTQETTKTNPTTLKGFVLERRSEGTEQFWNIRVEQHEDDPVDFSIPYVSNSERFQIILERRETNVRYFDMYDSMRQTNFTIQQQFRGDFSHDLHHMDVRELISFGNDETNLHGYVYDFKYEINLLYMFICWDDGRYVMTLVTDNPDLYEVNFPELFRATIM